MAGWRHGVRAGGILVLLGFVLFAASASAQSPASSSGNRLANTIERDGKTIVVMSRALPQLALVGDPNAAFDPLTLTWLGSLSSYQDDAYLVTVNAAQRRGEDRL